MLTQPKYQSKCFHKRVENHCHTMHIRYSKKITEKTKREHTKPTITENSELGISMR